MIRVMQLKVMPVVTIVFIAIMQLIYSIRIQMKLAALVILMAACGLLWLKTLGHHRQTTLEQKLFLVFFVCVIVAGAIVSTWIMSSAGPQPFRDITDIEVQ